MAKNNDWVGNKNSIYKTLGASSHTDEERELYDYYATDPKATELLLKLETFSASIWECACGEGHISKTLSNAGYNVYSSDFVDRKFGEGGKDFLCITNTCWDGDIITNPPYAYAIDFVYKSMQILNDGNKLALFLKLQFLEGKERKELFRTFPPKPVYVSSSRLLCAKNAEFQKMKDGGGSAVAYAWFIWEKGYKGETVIKWFN